MLMDTKKYLRAIGIKPVVQKDENNWNNGCFIVRGQRVGSHSHKSGHRINDLYVKRRAQDKNDCQQEAFQELEKILNLGETFKHIKMYSNGSIVVFDLQLGEPELEEEE